jgi:hypothetical protein
MQTELPEYQTSQSVITPSISANLHNKNKRKGFKQAMEGRPAEKIVFGDSSPNKRTNGYSYFVPPSEHADLPANIIVTSVDVEEGMWPKKKRKPATARHPQPPPREDTVLPYDDELPAERESEPQNGKAVVDWDEIDRKFDGYLPVQGAIIKTNQLLGYKACLNPLKPL